jgi:hypothetical protein
VWSLNSFVAVPKYKCRLGILKLLEEKLGKLLENTGISNYRSFLTRLQLLRKSELKLKN